MGDWRETTLGELGTLYDGPHATPVRRGEGPYFLNISSLKDGRLDLTESDHVSEQDFERWTRRVAPESGDLLFSYETRLGDAALMPDGVRACLGRRMALLRPDRSLIDPRFLLYYYLSPAFKTLIDRNSIHGATVNRIALSTMGDWSVRVPTLPEQRAIADVLSALDDKIAANTRLAATADELAWSIYSQRALGSAVRPMNEVLTPILGGTPARSTAEFWGGSRLWISAKDVTGAGQRLVLDTEEKITDRAVKSTKAKPLSKGSVILTARGTVGAVARLGEPASFNQSCYGFEPDVLPAGVLYFAILGATEQAKAMAHGSVFDTITMATFRHLSLPVLGSEEASALEARLAPHLSVVESVSRENRTLAAIRDTLLPQLMSGKLRVREAAEMADL